MDLKNLNYSYYDDQYRYFERHYCYCVNCNEKLFPYCIKHNDHIIMKHHTSFISCGATQCRQDFVSYYSPTKGCKGCFYGQSNGCGREACNYLQIKYPKGCTYCQHPLVKDIQLFEC